MRRFAACLALLAAAAAPAHAYTAIYSFGDSLSDVGNDFSAPAAPSPPPPYFAGRFSNGPNWLDDLAAYYGVGPLLPSLAGGTDYAFGGARSGANTHRAAVRRLRTRADRRPAGRPVRSHCRRRPVQRALHGLERRQRHPRHRLRLRRQPGHRHHSAISQAVTDEVDAVEALAADGATHLLVVGNPDLGATPALLATPLAGLGTALTKLYDTSLQQQISAIPGVSYLDLFLAHCRSGALTGSPTRRRPASYSPTGGYGDPNYLTDGSLCSLTQGGARHPSVLRQPAPDRSGLRRRRRAGRAGAAAASPCWRSGPPPACGRRPPPRRGLASASSSPLAPVGEPGIAQPGADRHHAPALDVLHERHLAQPLNHGVVVHGHMRLVAADARDRLAQPVRQVERLALPIARQVLARRARSSRPRAISPGQPTAMNGARLSHAASGSP